MHEESRKDRRDIDSLIDSALVSYGTADSRLEQRVLARISIAQKNAPRRNGKRWAAVLIGAAACLILSLILMRSNPVRTPKIAELNTSTLKQSLPGSVQHAEPAPREPTGALRHMRSQVKARESAGSRLPKRDVFPTPHPLSSAEQVLVSFAAHASKANREDFLSGQPNPSGAIAIADISVPPIQISPLELPDSGAN